MGLFIVLYNTHIVLETLWRKYFFAPVRLGAKLFDPRGFAVSIWERATALVSKIGKHRASRKLIGARFAILKFVLFLSFET